MTPVDSILARLLSLHPKRIDLTLDRMWRLLDRLGNPQQHLPPVIHVAGTNGKGSTIAFLRATLEAMGLSVHVYTSPHLVRFNERFRIGGPAGSRLVGDDELSRILAECEDRNGGDPVTVFEITTAAGLLLFSRRPADVLLLEVGLGGRLDATNVIEDPLVSIIAPVSLDHAEYLGATLAEIAFEKAGILKPGTPAVIATQHHDALRVIERQAMRVGAPLQIAGENWHVTEEHGRLIYQDEHALMDLPPPRLFGRHQFANAGTAIAALRAAGRWSVPARAIEEGLAKVEWPARLQRLTNGALVDLAPDGSELWLDGGHNPDGARAIAAAIADLEERVSRPLIPIVGMLSNKDGEGFLRHFAGLALRLVAVPIAGQEKSFLPQDIRAAAERAGIPASSAASVENALRDIGRMQLADPPRILITGSLYLAGEVLAANGTPPQ